MYNQIIRCSDIGKAIRLSDIQILKIFLII